MKTTVMKELINPIILTIVIFFINVFMSNIDLDKPKIYVSEPIITENTHYSIRVINGRKLDLKEFSFVSHSLISVNGTDDLKVTEEPFGNRSKYTIIYHPQQNISTFYITISPGESINLIKEKYELFYDINLERGFWDDINYAVINSVFYFLFLYLSVQFRKRSEKISEEMYELNRKKSKVEIEQLRSELDIEAEKKDKLNEELASISNDLDKSKQFVRKYLLLEKTILNDYSRENSYWRNLIKELMLSNNFSKKEVDDIYTIIQKSLKTYKTNINKNDYFLAVNEMDKLFESLKEEHNINSKKDT